MRNANSIVFLLASCSSINAIAGSPDYSNTLGNPGFAGSYVASFASYDDGSGESLYATGSFSIPGVSGGSLIARWDGNGWNPVGGGLQNQYSNTVTAFQGDLFVGGYFDAAGGVSDTAKLARYNTGTGWSSMDAQLQSFLSSVWDLTSYDDGTGEALIIAGNYQGIGGHAGLDHICKWDGTDFSPLGGTIGGAVPLIVLDVLTADMGTGSTLYAGGRFLNINSVDAANIASWNGSAWSPLGGGLTRTAGIAQVFHMTAWDDGNGMAIYAGGSFNRAGGLPVEDVAKWDGKSWSGMGDGFDSAVQELIAFDDGTGEALYALGNFTHSGAVPMNHIAKWNGSSWEAVGSGADANIFGAFVDDTGEGQSLIMGGSFNTAGGLTAHHVAAVLGAPSCQPDLNGDGDLNFFDVSAFLAAFSANDPIADFTGDGEWNFFDVSAFLAAFSAGCP